MDMSEKPPEIIESMFERPNLILDFESALSAVVEIESQISSVVDVKEKSILRTQMSIALEYLEEKKRYVAEDDREKFDKRSVTGFQGLGGFNRYIVRGDGTIGLTQSHSTGPCIRKAQELGVETPEFNF